MLQRARSELTSCAVSLVGASRALVGALGGPAGGAGGAGGAQAGAATALADCLTPLRRLSDLAQVKFTFFSFLRRVRDISMIFLNK